MSKYPGKNGRIMMSTTGASAAVAVGQVESWSIDRKTDRIETTCMGDANKTYIQSFPDMTGQFTAFFDAADDALFDASESSTAVNVYIYPDYTNAPGFYWYGTAFVDVSVSGGTKDAIKVSGSWAAATSWGRKP